MTSDAPTFAWPFSCLHYMGAIGPDEGVDCISDVEDPCPNAYDKLRYYLTDELGVLEEDVAGYDDADLLFLYSVLAEVG